MSPLSWMTGLIFFIMACSSPFNPGMKEISQPRVLSIFPEDGSEVAQLDEVRVSLSTAIDPRTVDSDSFLVVERDTFLEEARTAEDVATVVETEGLNSLPGEHHFSEDHSEISWSPDDTLKQSTTYTVIVTSSIRSPEHYPLTQTPREGNTPFISTFTLRGPSLEVDNREQEPPVDGYENTSGSTAPDGGESDSKIEVASEEDLAENVPIDQSEDGLIAETSVAEGNSPNTDVHFTEVVTDPQRDWNDTLGGNGIPFDEDFGYGVIGSTDEWLEIKNGQNDAVDLAGWSIAMIDGTDEEAFIHSSGATTFFSLGGSLETFLPYEYLVIGNPVGDMKNTITLRLIDEMEEVHDELIVEDSNASGIEDESYQLKDDGLWEMGEASIGF